MYEALLVLSVVLFAATGFVYLRHPAASIFHPVSWYLAFHGLVFVIRPIFAWYYKFTLIYDAVGFTPTLWDKCRVLICTNLALVVFTAVALWIARDPISFPERRAVDTQKAMLLNRFWYVAIPLGAIATYSIVWYWYFRLTGVNVSEADTYTGATKLVGVDGYFLTAGSMLTSICALIAYFGRFKLWSLTPFLFFAVLRLGTGIRGDFAVGAAMLGLLYLFYNRKKWPSLTVLLAAIPIVMVFASVQHDRGLAIREAFGLDVTHDAFLGATAVKRKPLETMDLANMEFFEYLAGVVPERTGTYDYFVQNLQLFVAPIPRTLWPGKPAGAPIKMFELYRYGTPLGATYSLPGMGWFYMGYLGVFIWSAFFGLIYGLGYKKFANNLGSDLAPAAYVIFLTTSIVGFRDGILLTIITQSFFFFIPVIALVMLVRSTKPEADLRLRDGGSQPAHADWHAMTPRVRRAARIGAMAVATPEPAPAAPSTPRERRLARLAQQ